MGILPVGNHTNALITLNIRSYVSSKTYERILRSIDKAQKAHTVLLGALLAHHASFIYPTTLLSMRHTFAIRGHCPRCRRRPIKIQARSPPVRAGECARRAPRAGCAHAGRSGQSVTEETCHVCGFLVKRDV